MKKLLALLMAVMMLTFAFTACAKKDSENSDKPQTETTENGVTSTTESTEEENGDAVEPDQSYEGESSEMSEFESLVDTFNNSEDEEAKEAARIELERILQQAEQQAQ